jgi:hypothetical protein
MISVLGSAQKRGEGKGLGTRVSCSLSRWQRPKHGGREEKFRREIIVDSAEVFEREVRGNREESEGKSRASSRAVGIPGGVGEKDDGIMVLVSSGGRNGWGVEGGADRWGPPVSMKRKRKRKKSRERGKPGWAGLVWWLLGWSGSRVGPVAAFPFFSFFFYSFLISEFLCIFCIFTSNQTKKENFLYIKRTI